MPDQELKPVREAYETAALLNGALALFIEAVVNKDGIKKADKERNVLAVAFGGLPETEGWYQVYPENAIHGGEIFRPITPEEAERLRADCGWDEVLHVDWSAIKAAKEGRPLALSSYYWLGYRRVFHVHDQPNKDALVVLAELVPKPVAATPVEDTLRS